MQPIHRATLNHAYEDETGEYAWPLARRVCHCANKQALAAGSGGANQIGSPAIVNEDISGCQEPTHIGVLIISGRER